MGALDQTFSNKLLNGSTAQAAFPTVTAPVHSRLMTVNGSATVNGTELPTGGGYTSGTGAPTISFGAASGGATTSNVAVTVTNMPATTIVGVEFWDSSGTPQRLWWGALTASKTTNAGDTFSLLSGQAGLSFP